MKQVLLIFMVSFFLISSNTVLAKSGSNKKRNGGMADYKKSTFTNIAGEVISVETVFNKVKQEDGLHLTVKTSSKEYIIHVCPQWYADKQKLEFKVGETLKITGSSFVKDGLPNIYAATITYSSSKTLNLRNPDTGETFWKEQYKQGFDEKMQKNKGKR